MKRQKKKRINPIAIIFLILVLTIIIGLIYFIAKRVSSNSTDSTEVVKNKQQEEEVVDNKGKKLSKKIYTFNSGAYCLVDKEPKKDEVFINHEVFDNINAKIINFETGTYDIELVKGDEVNMVLTTNNKKNPEPLNLLFNKDTKKYEGVYLKNTPIDKDTKYGPTSFNTMYILTKSEGGAFTSFKGDEIEIKLTKIGM